MKWLITGSLLGLAMLVAPVTPAGAAGPPPPACTPDGNGGCYLFYSATLTSANTGAQESVSWAVDVTTNMIASFSPSLYLPSGYSQVAYYQSASTPSAGPITGMYTYEDTQTGACFKISIAVYTNGNWVGSFPPC